MATVPPIATSSSLGEEEAKSIPHSSRKRKHEDHLNSAVEISRLESIVCGGSAGLVSRFVISPLDVVKIRLQLQIKRLPLGPAGITAVPGETIFKTVKDIYQKEGVKVFWKGNVPAEVMYVLYGAIQFTTYKSVSKFLNDDVHWLGETPKLLISGSLAGTAATCLTYPLDLLRTRFAADSSKQRSSILESVRSIARIEGAKGFYRGLSPTLLSLIPNMGIFFVTYEETRRLMNASNLDSILPAPEATAGFIAGVFSKGCVFPLDVIRKRLQVQGPSYGRRTDIPIYPGNLFKCAKHIVIHEGARGLYKGFLISLLKSGPSSAVTIWTFENSLKVMRYFSNNQTATDSF
ncbi:Tpc1p [Sugiyamaella lignohabitans]|uniref:Tpc1p n=1 Tax=Sugiyamaella lignohabitans TaxID=796027 RepID=A0A167EG91_9ASCO|nr:Tpc1p [Sugiyamaella lignohabitans]ANB14044.1 Tpc1p [Sugiyamaella lignohabitans]